MELEILKRFRSEECPTLTSLDGSPISTITKDEALKCLSDKCDVDGIELCRLGAIEPCHGNIVKLLHFAMEVAREEVPQPRKKQKVDDKTESNSDFIF